MKTRIYRYIGVSRGGDCSGQDPQGMVGDTVQEVQEAFAPITTEMGKRLKEMDDMDFGVYVYDNTNGRMVSSFSFETGEWE